jgi:hypothetical protein
MKSMNCWTRFLAFGVFTLAAIGESGAIAASSNSTRQTPSSNPVELAQIPLPSSSVCAFIKENTSLFRSPSSTSPQNIVLNRTNYVRISSNPPNAGNWVFVEYVRDPRISGYIEVRYLDTTEFCRSAPPVDQAPQGSSLPPIDAPGLPQAGTCYRVTFGLPNGRLRVYPTPRITETFVDSILSGETVYQVLNSAIEVVEGTTFIRVLFESGNSYDVGWVEFQSANVDGPNLRPCPSTSRGDVNQL